MDETITGDPRKDDMGGTINVVMVRGVIGEDGKSLHAGERYAVKAPFGAWLIARGKATEAGEEKPAPAPRKRSR